MVVVPPVRDVGDPHVMLLAGGLGHRFVGVGAPRWLAAVHPVPGPVRGRRPSGDVGDTDRLEQELRPVDEVAVQPTCLDGGAGDVAERRAVTEAPAEA